MCKVGCWIFAQSPLNVRPPSIHLSCQKRETHGYVQDATIIGRIKEILIKKSGGAEYVVLEQFAVGDQRHPVYQMPVLAPPQTEPLYILVMPKVRVGFQQ